MHTGAMRGLVAARWPWLSTPISSFVPASRAPLRPYTYLKPLSNHAILHPANRSSLLSSPHLLAARSFTKPAFKPQAATLSHSLLCQRTRAYATWPDRSKSSRSLPSVQVRFPRAKKGLRRVGNGRYNSTTPGPKQEPQAVDAGNKVPRGKQDSTASKASKTGASAASAKHLTERLPNLSYIHRPTKEELLAAATGFWSRLKVRFKWFSIRSARPFNSDEIFALVSWLFLGHMLWIILGTTTFVSLALLAVNTVSAQEALGRWIGNYLTKSSGVKIVFESAIVPKWKDGVISFKNVFVSKRPGQGTARVSKGSPETAAAAAAALVESGTSSLEKDAEDGQDTNYTQYDLSLDTVNVTLSFAKWFNGKGLLRDVEIRGVRGVVDRTHVLPTGSDIDPKSFRHEHNTGDFEIDSFKMDDLLVTVHQPGGFRPFPLSIFSCDLPRLRQQWMFYDFLRANNVSGSFDESLFTIHPRQMHNRVWPTFQQDAEGSENPWTKHSRLRIDGLKIDHLNRGVEGPFSWIQEGNVDIVSDVLFPAETDESIAKVMTDFYDHLEEAVTSKLRLPRNGNADGNSVTNEKDEVQGSSTLAPASLTRNKDAGEDQRFLVMDLRVHLNDVRAAVPLFTRDLSYVNNALIRPIVAYINSRKTFIPINCRVVKHVSDFDGSWTIFDSGLMDDLSAETYTAIARDVADESTRFRRFKKVGLWSLQLAVQALFVGMAGTFA